nr:hypothetical protein [Tanacetum cinerariifolium]
MVTVAWRWWCGAGCGGGLGGGGEWCGGSSRSVKGIIFGFGRKARRKSFLATAAVAGGLPEIWERERAIKPSSDGTTSEDIAEFEVASKSTSSTSKPKRRRKIPILDPPAGIFSNHLTSLFECDFVSLDSRQLKKSTMDHSFGSAEEVDHVRILQSCNGLLLCSGSAWPVFYYVYNPSTILFKRLSQPNNYLRDDSCFFSSGVFRLAFDPRKSSHYKVVQAGGKAEGLNRELKHCKLNMKDHDHPIMTSLEIAHGLHKGRNFLESFGKPINDLISLLMELPHMLHLERKFFKSCGCLLLVCRDDIGSIEFTIYEMMKGSFVWSVRGEYSQWRERFMNYLEEQTDGEAMINSIQNGDQPLPVIAQVSLARNAQNAPPTLKDPKFWTAEEKKTRKIDRLARSLLIQGLPNDIYSLIDSNETAKDLWDDLERQMRGSGYGDQDRKAAILYGYETFNATEGEQLLDTYLRYLQVINDLKKCGYKKDNCDVNDALGYKKKVVVVTSDPLALVAEKTKKSKRKEKVEVQTESEGSDDEDITSSSANKKPEYVKSVEKKEDKKANEKKRDMSKVKCYNCKKEGHFAKDCKKAKNGDQPLPVICQVSLAGNAQNAPPTLKDPKFWTDEEKKTQKIDRLARSILIQGLPNDIYSLIDSNKTAKELWDALERQMRGSEYGEQDRKAAILQTKNLMDINIDAWYNILEKNQGDVNDALGYKKKAAVITSYPLALVVEKMKVSKRKEKVFVSLDSEGSGVDDFSELKKITTLLAKAFTRRKFYSKPTNNNLRTSSTSQSANKKQEFVKSDDKKVKKKDDEKRRDMSKVKCYKCKNEGHFAKDNKKAKVKDYNYYKTKMLLAKKDSDEQVLLAEDQAWMESSSDSD